jgi:hypothetical protein
MLHLIVIDKNNQGDKMSYPLTNGSLKKGPTGSIGRRHMVEKFIPGLSIADIESRIRSNYYCDLTPVFDQYPIVELRQKIIRYWLAYPVEVLAHQVDWIEQRIIDLADSGSDSWKDLMNWYLFNTKCGLETDIAPISRVFDFAIKFTERRDEYGRPKDFFCRSYVLKIITGRLEGYFHGYFSLVGVKLEAFLLSFLEEIYLSKYDIVNFDMVDVRRVIRCAEKMGNWDILPQIEKVRMKVFQDHEKKKDWDFQKEAQILETEAFLRGAEKYFEAQITKQKAE